MPFPGIPLPEEVVRNIAQSVIDKLDTNDFTIVEWAIGQLSPAERSSMRTAFHNRPGKARLGWHLEDAEDWQVTVVLGGTTSPYRSIGDAVGPTEEEVLYEDVLPAAITAERGVFVAVTPPPEIDDDIGGVLRLVDEVAVWQRAAGGVTLTYRGVQATVAVAHPTGTRVAFFRLSERLGWGEMVQVRCDIHSTDAWFNLVLATTVKAALLASHAAFEQAGCTLHDLTETDVAPRPDFWPAPMMHRTLVVQVQRDFTVPEDIRVILDIQTDVQAVVTAEAPP